MVSKPENKLCVFDNKHIYDIIHQKKYRSGISSLHILERPTSLTFYGIPLKPYSPFNHLLNDIVLRLAAAGIFENDYKNFYYSNGHKRTLQEDIGPQVLTMEHVEIGFLVCLIPCFLSIVAFVLECLIPRVRKGLKAFVGNIVFLIVTMKYLEVKAHW